MEVKQVFGFECGRSALTGVGFILLDGLAVLQDNGQSEGNVKSEKRTKSMLTSY